MNEATMRVRVIEHYDDQTIVHPVIDFPIAPGVAVNHDLKSWVGLFEPILNGVKTHDLRVMDRDYRVGDVCRLREYEPTTREYTGREVVVRITYITSGKHQHCAFSPFALHPGMAILSVSRI